MLVLTDFFRAADRALDYATNLAVPLHARLVLMHVREQAGHETPSLTNLSPEALTLALNCLTRELPVPVVAEVGYGPLPAVVPDALRRHHPALLVLGRTAEAKPDDEPVTDTAALLLRTAPYPMLVVPANVARPTRPRRILLAVDGEPFSLGEHAGTARHLLSALQAEITLLHSSPVTHSPSALASIEDSVLRTGLAIDLPGVRTRCVVAADPVAAILEAAQPADFDAVAVVARGRSFCGRLFHRSVTAQVLLESPLPVLVLPAAG
ncbi:hypothetical protein GCM10027048_21310 [Hymenobacter coalescens]